MKPGQIVLVDWRDAIPDSGEPNKRQPGIVIGSPRFFDASLPFEIVVPLSGESALAIDEASTSIEPTPQNGCTKRSYVLAWKVQTVPHSQITETTSRITDAQVGAICAQIRACIDA